MHKLLNCNSITATESPAEEYLDKCWYTIDKTPSNTFLATKPKVLLLP